MLFSYLAHACTKKLEAILKLTLAQHQKDEESVQVQRTIAEWNKIKENFVKRFHPLGRTTEQLEFKWNNLKWSQQLESIEEKEQKINQLATALGKTEPDKVLKLKMSDPNQEIYLFIMTCTTTEEIVVTINKFQAMSYFLKSSTPGLNPPTTQTTNYAVAAQQVKSVNFASGTQNNIPDWAENFENKLSDQMTKLTKSISKLTHDRHRNDRYNDSYDDRYDDRHDGYKPRYCDGHREERDRDYEDYGTYRKRYRSPCRHDPRKSEKYQNCPESQIEEQMDEIAQSSVNIYHYCSALSFINPPPHVHKHVSINLHMSMYISYLMKFLWLWFKHQNLMLFALCQVKLLLK